MRFVRRLLAPAILLAIVLSGCARDAEEDEVDLDTIMGRKVIIVTTTLYPMPSLQRGELP